MPFLFFKEIKKEEKDIFISFHNNSKDQIESLNSKLETIFKTSLNCFTQEEDDHDESENHEFLESYDPNEIKKAKIFLCYFSNDYLNSDECKRELEYAISLKKNIIVLKENNDDQDKEVYLKKLSNLTQIDFITFTGDLTKWLGTNLKTTVQTLVYQILNVNIFISKLKILFHFTCYQASIVVFVGFCRKTQNAIFFLS